MAQVGETMMLVKSFTSCPSNEFVCPKNPGLPFLFFSDGIGTQNILLSNRLFWVPILCKNESERRGNPGFLGHTVPDS